jgi:FkbM family methyltransferase
MWARNDVPNDMTTNGELRLQRMVVANLALERRLIAFDVGARIGDWSRSLVENASGRPGAYEIHAFEPVPESRSALEESFAQQIRQGEMRVNAIALSDELQTVPIYVPHSKAGTSTLHPDPRVSYEAVLEAKTSTIDEYCRENLIDRVDLIKIDTEGNDIRVIRGASEILKRGNVDVLQFEYNFRWIYSRSYLKDVFDLVRDMPYRVAKICGSALEVYVEWHPELERFFETNYALVHQRLIADLECRVFRIGRGTACEIVEGNGEASPASLASGKL